MANPGYDPTTGKPVYEPTTGKPALDCGGVFPPDDCIHCGNCCYSNLSAILFVKPVLTYTGTDPIFAKMVDEFNAHDTTNIPYGGPSGNTYWWLEAHEYTYGGELYNVGVNVIRDCGANNGQGAWYTIFGGSHWNTLFNPPAWDYILGFVIMNYALDTCCDFEGAGDLQSPPDCIVTGYGDGTVEKNACCHSASPDGCTETDIYWCATYTDGQCEAPPP